MEQWYLRNKVLIPWTLIGAHVAIKIILGLRRMKNGPPPDNAVLPSPLQTLIPKLSEAEFADQAYPPDTLPGARDVESPYGSLRVYEWGPENGRKVLFVHGITNPSPIFGPVAHQLADRGCRVMLFDLPGRGYSGAPLHTPHSSRLNTASIFLALTSSPISWTGNGSSFSLIGYSLGGGIAINFTSYFPSLVSSIVLLAPSGLMRPEHFTLTSRFLYSSSFINKTLLEIIIKRKLRSGDPPTKTSPAKVAEITTATEEVPKEMSRTSELSSVRPGITFSKILDWQLDRHLGFVMSFISSIRYGPIANQHADWQRIGQRLLAQKAAGKDTTAKPGLQNGKVLIILGAKDVLVVKDEIIQDAKTALGEDNVQFEVVNSGHDIPVEQVSEVVSTIAKFWEL